MTSAEWGQPEGTLLVLDSDFDDDGLVFIISDEEIMLSAHLSREEIEHLASFLVEWAGLPIYFSGGGHFDPVDDEL